MKFSSFVVALSTVAATIATHPSRDLGDTPEWHLFPERAPMPLPTADVSPASTWTNAERLRRGLVPKAPQARAPTPVKRSAPSPTHYYGNVLVNFPASKPKPSGLTGPGPVYLASHPTDHGYFTTTTVQSQALHVSFSASGSDKFEIKISQPTSPGLKYVGAIQGYNMSSKDLGPGSSAYAAFGVSASASDGTPQQVNNGFTAATDEKVDVETEIWSYTSTNKTLTPTWTNSDGNAATGTSIQYIEGDEFFALTGDSGAFAKDYDAKVISGVTFTLGSN